MSLNIVNEPWIESPFFYQILKTKKNKVFKKYAIDMHEKGYCVIDLKLSANTINNINKDIAQSLNIGDFKTNPKIYHYNKYPRIVEVQNNHFIAITFILVVCHINIWWVFGSHWKIQIKIMDH